MPTIFVQSAAYRLVVAQRGDRAAAAIADLASQRAFDDYQAQGGGCLLQERQVPGLEVQRNSVHGIAERGANLPLQLDGPAIGFLGTTVDARLVGAEEPRFSARSRSFSMSARAVRRA